MDVLSTSHGNDTIPDLQLKAVPRCKSFQHQPVSVAEDMAHHANDGAFTPEQHSSEAELALQQLRQAMLGSRMGSRRQGRKCVVIELPASMSAPGESQVAMEMLREAALGSRQGSRRQGRKCVRFDLEQAPQKVMGSLKGLKVDELDDRRQFLLEFRRAEFLGCRHGSPRRRCQSVATIAEEKGGHRSETGTRQTRRSASERIAPSMSVKIDQPRKTGIPQKSRSFAIAPILRKGWSSHKEGSAHAQDSGGDVRRSQHDVFGFLSLSARPQSTGGLVESQHPGTPPDHQNKSHDSPKKGFPLSFSGPQGDVQVLRLPSPSLSPSPSPNLSHTLSPTRGSPWHVAPSNSPLFRSPHHSPHPSERAIKAGMPPSASLQMQRPLAHHVPPKSMSLAPLSPPRGATGAVGMPLVHDTWQAEPCSFPHSTSVQIQRPLTPRPGPPRSQTVSGSTYQGLPPRSPPLTSAGAPFQKHPNINNSPVLHQSSSGCTLELHNREHCSLTAAPDHPSIICPPRNHLAFSSHPPAQISPRAGAGKFPGSASMQPHSNAIACPPPRSKSLAASGQGPSPAVAHRQVKVGFLKAVLEEASEEQSTWGGDHGEEKLPWGRSQTQHTVTRRNPNPASEMPGGRRVAQQGLSPRGQAGLHPTGLGTSPFHTEGEDSYPTKMVEDCRNNVPLHAPLQLSPGRIHLSTMDSQVTGSQGKQRSQSQRSSPILLSPRKAQYLNVLADGSTPGSLVLSPRKPRSDASRSVGTSPLQRELSKLLGQRSIGARMNLDDGSSLYYSDDT